MGKFARKVNRTRCIKGKIRYKTRSDVRKEMKRRYDLNGTKTDAVFCYLCGAFHLVKEGESL